jgi:hypothetical protein
MNLAVGNRAHPMPIVGRLIAYNPGSGIQRDPKERVPHLTSLDAMRSIVQLDGYLDGNEVLYH